MLSDEKHFKDSSQNLGLSLKDTSLPIAYTKTDKLITALYMVTDIIDRDEPLRNKLRTLGTGIISDIHSLSIGQTGAASQASGKISEVMSFLDIASAMNIISQMNCNILRKEFLELDQAIKQSSNKEAAISRKIDLSDFFVEEDTPSHPSLLKDGSHHSKGQASHRLGVQKAGTLMRALGSVEGKVVSNRNHSGDKGHEHLSSENFDALKKHRREDIVNIIKILGGSATIKDIKEKAAALPPSLGSLRTCGDKTLQRELVSMVHDGVLKKSGEKRWSKYFVQ